MLFLTNEDVRKVLTMERCLEAVEDCTREIERGKVIPAVYSVTNYPYTDERSGPPGFEGPISYYSLHLTPVLDLVYGVSIVRINSLYLTIAETHGVRERVGITDPSGPAARVNSEMPSFVLLYDLYRPRFLSLMQEREINVMRVGAVGGLGAKYMARKDAHTIGLLGAGWKARAEIAAHCLVRDIHRVQVFSPTPQHREAFARQMSSDLGIEVRAVASAQEAIKGSDVVISATNTASQVTFDPDWVEPGMHVHCIHPGEYDEAMVAKADLIAWSYPGQDRITYGMPRAGEDEKAKPAADRYRHYMWGVLKKHEHKRVYLTDMIAGRVAGRTDDRQITFFSSPAAGTAGTERFAILVPRVYEMAKAAGIGKEMPDEWFHQAEAPLVSSPVASEK